MLVSISFYTFGFFSIITHLPILTGIALTNNRFNDFEQLASGIHIYEYMEAVFLEPNQLLTAQRAQWL